MTVIMRKKFDNPTKCAIFDFDGTLLETSAWAEYLSLLKDVKRRTNAHTEAWKAMLSHVDVCKEYEGIKEALEALITKGYCIGIVSSSCKAKVQKGLKHFCLDKYIDKDLFVCGSSKGGRWRNTKEGEDGLFQQLLDKLHDKYNLSPSETISFGNEPNDYEAASERGIKAYNCIWGAVYNDLEQMKHNCLYHPSDISNIE